ncbi:MAG TPA: hypothetical protein VJS92_11180, partial [Candidatus Polarisedimenticolaceae bacterium]|nr:hypothetical protein [Candidatus Polarisedimenticolaceae bacterium]
MIRSLCALVWLRWRLLINRLRPGRRRDAWEDVSRILGALAPWFAALLLLPTALGLGALGLWGGLLLGRLEPADRLDGPISHAVRFALLALSAVAIFVPWVRPGAGSDAGSRTRLLLLPIHTAWLHAAGVLAGLADPYLALLLAPALTLGLGLAAG